MRLTLLLAPLLAASVVLGLPNELVKPNAQVSNDLGSLQVTDANDMGVNALSQGKFCGSVMFHNRASVYLTANDQCTALQFEVRQFKVKLGCVCLFFRKPGCQRRKPEYVGYAAGKRPEGGPMPPGVKWYYCQEGTIPDSAHSIESLIPRYLEDGKNPHAEAAGVQPWIDGENDNSQLCGYITDNGKEIWPLYGFGRCNSLPKKAMHFDVKHAAGCVCNFYMREGCDKGFPDFVGTPGLTWYSCNHI